MCNQCGQPTRQHSSGYSRRGFLQLLSGVGAGLGLAGPPLFAAGEAPKPSNVVTPQEALARLKQGNERYTHGVMKRHDFLSEREALRGGQNPYAAILSCSDSRIAPEYAFDSGRGDLFVVRLAGNFTDEDGLASLEYAVKFLNTPLIVVLGHEKCGAVQAAIKSVKDGDVFPGHLPHLVDQLRPAVKAAMHRPGDLLENAIDENVRLNVEHLRTVSPILSRYNDEKKIMVVGGVYQLGDGHIDWLA